MSGSPEPPPDTTATAGTSLASSGASVPSWVQAWREGDVVGPSDKPEVAVGAAFAGGLLVALILKRLGR